MAMTTRHMPGDIVPNILLRLPAKSLMRFRCVCKSWRALVSDPNFMESHFNQTRANNKGYVLMRQPGSDFFSLHCDETLVKHMELKPPLNSLSRSFKVEGYSNGLVCLSCPKTLGYEDDIYLWNPAIQKCKALPNLRPLVGKSAADMYIAFAFVPKLNDYMVLKLLYNRYPGVYSVPFGGLPKVEIYSLRTDSWKEIQNAVPYMIYRNYSIDPILDGIVHWNAEMETEVGHHYGFILSFDISKEVFGEIKLPECYRDERYRYGRVRWKFVMVLKESFSLLVTTLNGENERLDIWVMKEYGVAESWTKQFTFDYGVSFLFPLGFLKNGDFVLRPKDDDGELVSYDTRVQQAKCLHIPGLAGIKGRLSAFNYCMESLVLLNEGN